MSSEFEGQLKISDRLMDGDETIDSQEDVEKYFTPNQVVEIVARYVEMRRQQRKSRKKTYLRTRELLKLAREAGLDKEVEG